MTTKRPSQRRAVITGLLVFLSAASLAGPSLADSTILGLWQFDNNLLDSSGNGFHGTVGSIANGLPSITPGGSAVYSTNTPSGGGSSLNFGAMNGGATKYGVSVGNSAFLNPTDAMTTAVWFNTGASSGSNAQPFIDRSDGSGSATTRAYSMHINANGDGGVATNWTRPGTSPQANINSNNDASLNSLDDGNWHHMAVTVDSISNGGDGFLRLYVDGVLEYTDNQSLNSIYSSPYDTIIGYLASTSSTLHYNEGLIDDMVLFRGALTETEIQTIMTGDFTAFGVTAPLTPEPGSLLVWGIAGLIGAGLVYRRQKASAV